MFEREIKFIYDFNLNKLNKYGSFFSFEQLRDSEIHPAIIQYVSAELDYLIFEDRQKLVKDSIFDYSGEKVSKYFALINEELKKSKRLSSDYIAKIILHSISFNVNFLVRPKWALTKFIYEEESHRTSAEIKQILNYLHFYKYLKKIIITYINDKKIISLNSAEFVALLNKIDNLTIQADYAGIMSVTLKSMAEFFNIGGGQKTKIPFNAIQIFLEDKGLDVLQQKLRKAYPDESAGRIEFNDAYKLLTAVPLEKVEPEPDEENEDTLLEAEPEPINIEETKVRVSKETAAFEHGKKEADENEGVISQPEKKEADENEDLTPQPGKKEENKVPDESKIEMEAFLESLARANAKDNSPKEDAEEKKSAASLNTEHSVEQTGALESIIEDEPARSEDEMIVDDEEKDYNDWVFVEEDKNDEIIKEFAEAEMEPEPEPEPVKKNNTKKKKEQEEEIGELSLFNGEEKKSFKDIFEEEENIYENEPDIEPEYEGTHKDFSKLLEHKNMPRIIETLFDCDIEEVELMLNSISFFKTYSEAENFIDAYFVKMGINRASAEAVSFKEIIKDNFTGSKK